MRVTVITKDKAIYLDNEVLFFDFEINPEIHAIQWDGDHGVIEYLHGSKTESFNDISVIQPFIDAFSKEKEKINAQSSTLTSN